MRICGYGRPGFQDFSSGVSTPKLLKVNLFKVCIVGCNLNLHSYILASFLLPLLRPHPPFAPTPCLLLSSQLFFAADITELYIDYDKYLRVLDGRRKMLRLLPIGR